MDQVIDLRSDTVTQPCSGMRQAMAEAPLGDDVYGEDPSINALQDKLAAMAGHEAGLYLSSGTQSNLVALLSHCQRGDEYLVAQRAHTYKYEGGGAAVLGGIQPQPLEPDANGMLDLDQVEAAIKEDDVHFAKTRLLALENTTNGYVLPTQHIVDARALADRHGLAFHLDGARVFNAAVSQGKALSEITGQFHSVSICLSKGLGAPVGSVLCGSKDFIERAHRWRKVVGGGMRQAGMLAAAGNFALDNNVARLSEDHALAKHLAEKLAEFPGVEIVHGDARTNMVFFRLENGRDDALLSYAKVNGVLYGGSGPMRMVAHKDVNQNDIDSAIEKLSGFFE